MSKVFSKIPFFSKEAIFEDITDSNSGAILKKVIDQTHTYFLKIIDNDKVDIDKLKEIITIYEKAEVKTIQLLNYGYLEDKIYLIYNFIEGLALNKIYHIYQPNDFYHMGYEIGCSYKKINVITNTIPKFKTEYMMEELITSRISEFLELYNNELSYINKIISSEKIKRMIERMEELIPSFSEEKKVYIHADIHPKNIMLSKNNELYVIDIESFCLDYFTMNLRWSLAAAFKCKENNEFFKGFINGYYDTNIPSQVNKQLILILLLNFMEHVIEFSRNQDKVFIEKYVSQINLIFQNINIFSNENILVTTTIFEE